MPFCYECGFEVNSEWKFCPNCKSSLANEKNFTQTGFTQKDSVIVGDLTINQQNTNFESQILICKNCGSEGNITLKPCIRAECSIKSCESCLQRYGKNCGFDCHSKSKSEALERERERDKRMKEKRERDLKEQQAKEKREKEIQEKKKRETLLANKAYQRQQLSKFILGIIFIAIPAIIMLGFTFHMWNVHSQDLEYTCISGEKIDGWEVLDNNPDCSDGSDEMNTEENVEHKQWVEEQNDTIQPEERDAALSLCGSLIFGLIFYFAIWRDFFWEDYL